MGKFSKIFGGGKPDTSALRAQEQRLKEQEEKLAEEEKRKALEKNAKLRASRGRQGTRSLLSGLETGVSGDEKRSNLG